MKKIGIIGSGVVAQALGSGFVSHGYEVMLGTRDAKKLAEWQKQQGNSAKVGDFAQTSEFGDLVVLAVKGTAAKSALEMSGAENISGKTIIDATNPIADAPPEDGVLKFFTGQNDSLMEQLQMAFPQANFVKAFNSVTSAKMVNPSYELKPSMFICGDDENAKNEVSSIVEQFGWEVEDMGTAKAARAIEPICMLYCIPGFRENRWTHAFKVMNPKP